MLGSVYACGFYGQWLTGLAGSAEFVVRYLVDVRAAERLYRCGRHSSVCSALAGGVPFVAAP